MASSVSIPEKTLEHWSSQYVTYRYHSKAALWWPATGEDIDLSWLPKRPGKAVQLELKTTTLAGTGVHDVLIDLGQLWEYHQRPLGQQPFYVFPCPAWTGDLASAAKAAGRQVTELGFARSGRSWWFANWMTVLTTAQVADVLHAELTTHGTRTRGSKKRLVRFDLTASTKPAVTWGAGATPPDTVRWREFWPMLERCGKVGWPQLIVLPAQLALTQDGYPRSHVIQLLQQAADLATMPDRDRDEFVALTPEGNDSYQISSDLASGLQGLHESETDQGDDHRQVIFLDARAMLPAK